MSSRKALISVFSQGRVVEGPIDRPVRLMPGGSAGVVYAGAVYPLYRGDSIDLGDVPEDKSRCPGFVAAGAAIPYATKNKDPKAHARPSLERWFLESNSYGNYLVFDGSEAFAQQIADLMVASGLGVRRWDASFRPASNGIKYDWFVRLEFEGPGAECVRRIGAVVDLVPPTTTLAPYQSTGGSVAGTAPAKKAAPLTKAASAKKAAPLKKVAPPKKAAPLKKAPSVPEVASSTQGSASSSVMDAVDEVRTVASDVTTVDLADVLAAVAELRAQHEQALSEAIAKAEAECLLRVEAEAEAKHAKARLAEAERGRARLVSELDEHRGRAETDRLEIASLRGEVARLATTADTEAELAVLVGELTGRLSTADGEMMVLNELLQVASDEASARERVLTEQRIEVERLNDLLRASKQQRDHLEGTLAEVMNERKESAAVAEAAAARGSRPRDSVDAFLRRLLGRVELDDDGIEVLLGYPQPTDTVRVLLGLEDGSLVAPPLGKWAPLREVDRHLHTGVAGKPNLGRVYFCPSQDSSRVLAFVHHKKNDEEQERQFAVLSKRARSWLAPGP